MAARHATTAGPMSLPLSLTDGTLTRAGIAAALVTASAAAVAGSTGTFTLPSLGSASADPALMAFGTTSGGHTATPAASSGTMSAGGVSSATISRVAMGVTPAVAAAPVKHTSPAAKAAADQRTAAAKEAASKKASDAKAATAKQASSSSSDSATSGVASAGPLGDRIVSKAATFKGTPYVFGGTTPDGFDCSGFTKYVFKQMGISLPRTAQQQYNAAQHISESQAQPGDLVFMGSSSGIYHVAIYAGNGKIWTAPQTGESVKLGNLWGDYHFGRIR